MADENGETRRERNENFGFESPPLEIPEAGEYLWFWYWEISNQLNRNDQGRAVPISWSDINNWKTLTGNLIRPNEIEILLAMDKTFCAELNLELKARAERDRDKAEQEAKRKQRRI